MPARTEAAVHDVIAIAPIGDEPLASYFPQLAAIVREVFARDVVAAPALPLPPNALDTARAQYRSTVLLDALASIRQRDWERLLGITAVDLFAPGLHFVFGEADPRRGVAVMSTWRLRGSAAAEDFLRLVATEAVHELGHTYGLGHCRNPRCVMWFSNTLGESVRKGYGFCSAHAAQLASVRR